MRTKLLAGTAALALAAVVVTAGSASAEPWHRGYGWGPAGFAAGVVGGAVAAATSPLWAPGYYGYADSYYSPGYAYAPEYTYDDAYAYEPGYAPAPVYRYSQRYATGGRDDAYCAQRYRSYDPASGTYLGYDGIRHACP
jgi:hypothetical protein